MSNRVSIGSTGPLASSRAIASVEKMKFLLDSHMKSKFSHISERMERREQLEKTMEAMNLSGDVKKQMQARLRVEEEEANANRRKKMSVNDFETLTIIGRGAFGEVRVCRKKDDKKVYAMKIMKKTEMLKKNQVKASYSE